MKSRLAFSLLTFVLGIGVTVAVIANPAHWSPLDRARSAIVSTEVTSATGPSAASAAPAQTAERTIKFWRAPMDPTYIRDKPGKSPMGMDLIPVYEDEGGAPPPGTVRIDPVFVQNMGVKSEPVRRVDIPFTIRTVGTLAYNDQQVALITTKYDGWIEKVHVNYVGEPVKKGQDLFDIYSPQLVTTEQEYLQAIAYAKKLADSPYPDAAARAKALVASARQRLQYWDISDAQIDELARSGAVQRTLCVVSPVNGLVVQKMDQALEGMRATAGMQLYKIVDLSKIWVDVQIFEHQVSWLKIGQRAAIELPYEPGRRYTGVVRFLHPSVDQKTRTMTASIELPNPGLKLRADMYATVTIDVPSARGVLAVPENAVIHSGARDVVVLDLGNGLFQARDVTLGVNGNGVYQVTRGVEAGDRVVVSAQFLIDSESNLKAAIANMSSASADGPSEAAPPALAQASPTVRR
jgi:membrane fusion protein, copper/silver efflux system